MNLETTITKWLQKLQIKKSSKKIKDLLLCHPEYPSALAITDTLSYLGVNSGVYNVTTEHLAGMLPPYLVHLSQNGGEFKLINSNPITEIANFEKTWSNIIILAEKPPGYNNIFANRTVNEKIKQIAVSSFIAVVILVNFISGYLNPSLNNISLITTSLLGIGISYLIFAKEFGVSNQLSEMICDISTCEDVLKSTTVTLPLNLKPSDLCVTWFIFLNVLGIFGTITKTSIDIYLFIGYASVAGLVCVLFSIYIQARIIKKWCKLCLLISGILVIQFAFFAQDIFSGLLPNTKMISILIIILIFIATGWFLLKQLIIDIFTLQTRMYDNFRFKFNETTFHALLRQEEFIGIEQLHNEVQLGNHEAITQITIVNSATCAPCSEAYKVIEKILRNCGPSIGIRMRFALSRVDINNSRGMILKYILNILHSTDDIHFKRLVLHDWYESRNFERFKSLYDASYSKPREPMIDHLLDNYLEFAARTNTTATPTFFINDWKLPQGYGVKDIESIVQYISFQNTGTVPVIS